MKYKWLFKALIFLSILGGFFTYFLYTDDLRITHITSFHSPAPEWDNPPLSHEENQILYSILSKQPFTYLSEGGQSMVFVSADQKHVLKLFKFRRFRPTSLVSLLPNISFLTQYKENHTKKRHNKWLAAFNGHKLAYDLHRSESGLVYIQLNHGLDHTVKVEDRWGAPHFIDLKNTPFILQEKGETFGATLTALLDKKEIDKVHEKIDQLFALYLSAYQKGILDTDYGIMHNVGVIQDRLIHLDVGKLVYDDKMKLPAYYEMDLSKVATKIKAWIQNKYPAYSATINHYMETRLSEYFGKPYYLPEKDAVEECKNIFLSPVYYNYDQQRKNFLYQHPLYLKSSILPEVNSLTDLLKQPIGNPHEQREHHTAIVNELRRLSTVQFVETEAQHFYEDILRWTFLGATLQPELSTFLYKERVPSQTNLQSLLLSVFQTTKENPQFYGVKKRFPYEDHLLEGNLPFKIGTVNQTTLFRMGQPTGVHRSYTWFYQPTLLPEFIRFLKLQPNHLYVNLMKRQGQEGAMSQSIESLEKQIPTLFVITLDKSSSFYWQSNEKDSVVKVSSFKDQFMKKMFSNNGFYYWSDHLDQLTWIRELKEIVDSVHKEYFVNHSELDRKQRQDFIEVTYLKILDSLVEKWNPISMNISCRQCIDRGPSLSTLWLYQKNMYSDQEIAAMLLAPPVLVHNRPAHNDRVERFISALDLLQKN